jgi:predicted O-methyltransferase YrrM
MKNDESGKLLARMQHLLAYHETLLRDEVRNSAVLKALKRHVDNATSVLDIGSGTGVWAIAAAQLGAKRVVAIEKENLLVPIIQKLANKNGVADRVEVIHGDSREVKLSGKFDVVISETIGNEAFDEAIVPIMIDARKRFLKRGGVLIPRSIASVMAPAFMGTSARSLPAGLSLQYDYLEVLIRDIPKRVRDRSILEIVGKQKVLREVDLATVQAPPDLTKLTVSWKLKDASRVNCLVLWAEVVLSKGIRLRTIDSPNWTPIAFPLESFAPGPATLECQLTFTDQQYHWTVVHSTNGKQVVQSHSPVFPYTFLQALLGRPSMK